MKKESLHLDISLHLGDLSPDDTTVGWKKGGK